MPISRALILSGGGGRGAYQAGVWAWLEALGWCPDLVCGSSVIFPWQEIDGDPHWDGGPAR